MQTIQQGLCEPKEVYLFTKDFWILKTVGAPHQKNPATTGTLVCGSSKDLDQASRPTLPVLYFTRAFCLHYFQKFFQLFYLPILFTT